MSYTKDRDEFLLIVQAEGLPYSTATKLLRYSQTLHRLAEAQCNGDWPADNGERETEACPQCGMGFVKSSFKKGVCPDCYASEQVKKALPEGFKPVFSGDPRGCVLKIQVPSGLTNDWANEGICVPTRER